MNFDHVKRHYRLTFTSKEACEIKNVKNNNNNNNNYNNNDDLFTFL